MQRRAVAVIEAVVGKIAGGQNHIHIGAADFIQQIIVSLIPAGAGMEIGDMQDAEPFSAGGKTGDGQLHDIPFIALG